MNLDDLIVRTSAILREVEVIDQAIDREISIELMVLSSRFKAIRHDASSAMLTLMHRRGQSGQTPHCSPSIGTGGDNGPG